MNNKLRLKKRKRETTEKWDGILIQNLSREIPVSPTSGILIHWTTRRTIHFLQATLKLPSIQSLLTNSRRRTPTTLCMLQLILVTSGKTMTSRKTMLPSSLRWPWTAQTSGMITSKMLWLIDTIWFQLTLIWDQFMHLNLTMHTRTLIQLTKMIFETTFETIDWLILIS